MAEKKYLLVQWKGFSGTSPYLTLTELAFRCGVHPELIDRFVHLGLIDLVGRDESGEPLFQPEVTVTVRKILRLRNQLGVNYTGVGVILELMSRIESMESYIRELESKIFSGD
jgi:MerR family transcriptional regulator, heat shock protein HspR